MRRDPTAETSCQQHRTQQSWTMGFETRELRSLSQAITSRMTLPSTSVSRNLRPL
jgi:hypothetical protein